MIKHLTPRSQDEILNSMKGNDHEKMRAAIDNNLVEIAKLLLSKTLNVNVYKDEFVYAVSCRHPKFVKLFLDEKINFKNILSTYGLYVLHTIIDDNVTIFFDTVINYKDICYIKK